MYGVLDVWSTWGVPTSAYSAILQSQQKQQQQGKKRRVMPSRKSIMQYLQSSTHWCIGLPVYPLEEKSLISKTNFTQTIINNQVFL